MASDLENFKAWYVETLSKLYPFRNSGFPILMIAFPLIERYLRNKNRLSPKENLSKECMENLREMFPDLLNNKAAWKFWNIFRNGVLHQVTLSRENRGGKEMPEGWLSHDIKSAITIESDGSFLIHPVIFTKQVVNIIENDFGTFEKSSGALTKLPNVKPHPIAKNAEAYILGTNTEK